MYGALTLCPYPRQMYNLKCINVHIPYPSLYVQCITIIHTSTFKRSLVYFFSISLVLLHFLVQLELSLSTHSVHITVCTLNVQYIPYIHQNLHRNFVLLHSQNSKTFVHKPICTVLHNTISIIQNKSTTLFSMCMYLSKLTQKFCTSAFTEIQNFCA